MVSCARSRSTPERGFPPRTPLPRATMTLRISSQSPFGAPTEGLFTPPSRPSISRARTGRATRTLKRGEKNGGSTRQGDSSRTVQVAQRDVVREEIARTAALGAAAPVLIAIPLAWLVVGWAMNRVLARLNAIAHELAKRSVGATAPIALDGIPVEVAPFARSMNSLIVRLHDAIDAQRRFISDAAHELRTPLAAMQIQVDNLSRETGSSHRRAAAAVSRGVRRATALVNQLLDLARLDEKDAPRDGAVDVNALLLKGIADHAPLAEEKGVDIEVNVERQVRCPGAPNEVRALFSSLIDNAVRYTPSGGRIDISIEEREILLHCRNRQYRSGPAGWRRGRVFDRFFRAAPQGTEGMGLGLAIASRVAERHGFALTVENRNDASGVVARVSIPTS